MKLTLLVAKALFVGLAILKVTLISTAKLFACEGFANFVIGEGTGAEKHIVIFVINLSLIIAVDNFGRLF